MKHKHNIDSLIAALKDRNPRIRRNAAYVLGRKKDRRVLPALITTVLNDKNQYVQEFALAGLSRHKIKDIRIIKSLLR